MRKNYFASGITLIVISILLLILTTLDIISKTQKMEDEIPANREAHASIELKRGDKITFSFKSDNEIKEVFICDEENFKKWKNGEKTTKLKSVRNETTGTINFEIPYDDRWYFVFDNKNSNSQNTNVEYEVKIVFYSIIQLLFYSSLTMLIFGIILFAFAFYKKVDIIQYQPSYQSQYKQNIPIYYQQQIQYKTVLCTNCGFLIEIKSAERPIEIVCQNCGNREVVF